MSRTLIIRPGAIGDFIVSLPAMQHLSSDYTEVWTASPNVPLARFADRARSIASVGLDRLGIMDAEDVIQRLRAFDSIFSWYGANRPEFRELVHSLDLPFTFYPALPDGASHATDFFLRQVGAPLGEAPHIECRVSHPAGFAVIHPFASSPAKRWPLNRFESLAAKLEEGMPVHWCHGPEEKLPISVYIENLYELGCWIATASVYIGNDSGIGHLAAAVGTPVVALFGPTDSAVWSPRGPYVKTIARSPIDAITVEEVFARIAC